MPTKPPTPTQPDPDQAPGLPYDIAAQALQRQLDSAGVIDSKLTNAVSGAVGLAAILGAVLALRPAAFVGATVGCFYAALAVLAIIVGLWIAGTTARTWRTGPPVEDVIEDFRAGTDEIAARWKVVRNLIGAREINDRVLATKTRMLDGVYGGVGVELAFVLIALVLIAN